MNETAVAAELDIDAELERRINHARCTMCNPGPRGSMAVALCGVLYRVTGRTWPKDSFPPNACPDCTALWHTPCGECGLL